MIHVAIAFDAKMMQGACVTALSAIQSTKERLTIHFLTPSPLQGLNRCIKYLEAKGGRVVHHLIGDKFGDLPAPAWLPPATLYRFLLPDLIDAKRVLYLDADTVVVRDLAELHQADLGGAPLAAMVDYPLYYWETGHHQTFAGETMSLEHYLKTIIGSDPARKVYFNSGVLVMDLDLWRTRYIASQAIAFLRGHDHPLIWFDQDALNAVIGSDYAPLDARWNSFAGFTVEKFRPISQSDALWEDVVRKWAEDPWIVHFASHYKPWRKDHNRTPLEPFFWNVARQLPSPDGLLIRCMRALGARSGEVEPEWRTRRWPLVERSG